VVISDRLLITPDIVRQALDALINISAPHPLVPLNFLLIVDLYLTEHDLSFTTNPRQYAFNNLLINTIHTEYQHHRDNLNLPRLAQNPDLKSAIATIRTDAELNHPELLGWDWLYFHYIENALRISHQQFAEWINVDERTLRRYQQHALQSVTDYLVSMESDARDKLRRKRLMLQLPRCGAVTLFGRDEELQQAKKLLTEPYPQHLLITGPSGIGKSAFVECLIKQFIDSDEQYFEKMVWIDSPISIQFIEQHLREQLLPEHSSISIDEYFLLKRVVVILDDITELQNDPKSLDAMLQLMRKVSLVLTSSSFQRLPNCSQLILAGLSESYLHKLLRSRLIISQDRSRDQLNPLTDCDIATIWKKTEGNPAAALLIAHNLSVFDSDLANALTAETLYTSLYLRLTNKSKCLWLTVSLLRQNKSVVLKNIVTLWPTQFSYEDFTPLIRAHLVEVTDSIAQEYSLSPFAHRFIQDRFKFDAELQINIQRLIMSVDFATRHSDLTLDVLEAILMADWLNIDIVWRIHVARNLWRLGVEEGRWSVWATILEQYTLDLSFDNLDLTLGRGVCLRCLAQWSEAQIVFESIIDYAGRAGSFTEQSNARLELAVLLRYRGEYARSRNILEHLKILPDYPYSDVLIEEIELVLDTGEAYRAIELLHMLPETPRKFILQMEVQVATKNTDISYLEILAEKALSSFQSNTAVQARVYTLLGRSYEQIREYTVARTHYSIAVKLLEERDDDPYGMARAQSNLGALLTKMGDYTEAQNLLEAAEHIQRIIKDHVGLATTRHNLRLLYQMFAN
jgi:tetratricopeptide (TPR) repeat protein